MKLRLSSSGKFRLRSAVAFAVSSIAAPVAPPPSEDLPVDNSVTVAATEVSNNRIFQRVGTSKAISLSGTYTGSPSSIQARLVNADTGAAVTSWATVATAPTSGSFAGSFSAPQGSWYKLQFRGVTAAGASDPISGVNRFGVGIVGLLIGQSNMVNRRSTGLKNPLGDKRSIEYRAGAYARAGNINDAAPANTEIGDPMYGSPVVQGNRSDGFILLANLLAQAIDLPVCLIEKANSGSSVLSWIPGGSNWLAAMTELNAAGGDCEFMLWHQGETNATDMPKETMKGHLAAILQQAMTQTGRTASNFHFGVVALGPGSFNGSSEGEFGNMRAAHVEFATSTPGAYLSTCAHDVSTGTDPVHIGGDGYNRMVKRDARSLCSRFGAGVSGAGPYVTGATRSGAVVTLAIAHNGGTALLDGAGGSGTALTGFQVYDGGVAVAISGTAIVGNSIRLTLASTPSGAVTVAYAMMNNPHHTDPNNSMSAVILASVPYDNVTLHRTTNGCPLQPFAPIPVTGA